MHPTLQMALTLLLVIDPVGNVPVFLAMTRKLTPRRRLLVIFRECCIALGLFLVFLYFGPAVLSAINVEGPSLEIAGAVVIFLISLRLIFPMRGGVFGEMEDDQEPLLTPLAVPLLAGPSSLATLTLIGSGDGPRWHGLAATLFAWAATTAILLLSAQLARWLGRRVLVAIERLMGMLLAVIAVDMFLHGVAEYFGIPAPG